MHDELGVCGRAGAGDEAAQVNELSGITAAAAADLMRVRMSA